MRNVTKNERIALLLFTVMSVTAIFIECFK